MENKTKGIILILLSALFFALMAAAVKFLDGIPVAEKIFFRNLFGLFVAIYMVRKKKEPILGHNKKLLLLRSVSGLLGVAAYFFALSKINLADAVILNKMSPFFVLILSFIFLGEKIKRHQVFSLVLALIGAGLVIKPQFNFNVVPALIALMSALFAGIAYTVIRHLRHTDAPETIVLYFTAISTFTMIPFMMFGYFKLPTFTEIIGLVALGIFATTAQFLMTNAYRYAPAGELAIYTYINIVFSSILGLTIWSEIPDILTVIGGIFIIGAGFLNYHKGKQY